ncbi:MAG: proline--tRNA ligase [Candidatus Caldarchaeum sp.]|uniref:Proline--tRNA ligase n=1 Tax=Caldiarchaeum subterraneum TaxID=311458 RepID=A0A7J3VUC4_CALS0
MSTATALNKYRNFSEWFDSLLLDARIVDDRFPVKGFSVYLENGAFILRRIREMLENELNTTGHKEMIFPLVTTDELFGKESQHIKGFSPEVFVIESAGGKPLDVKLVVRPTSETIMYPMFKLWVRSHADLPLLVHQSNMVYRHETKATRPLLRVREIPWNEAHTVHATAAEAEQQVRKAVEIYKRVLDRLGVAYLVLKRPDFDKFAGAKYSVAFDAWNPDGRVNQVGTVHNLGKNFSKVFEIEFETKNGDRDNPHQLCYGFGYSRVLAALISQHGDDRGLVLPSAVAPLQVVVVPIVFKGQEETIVDYCRKIVAGLKDLRIMLDDREDITPGEKFYHWEKMGVPVRVEAGPREVAENTATVFRRDTLEKRTVSLEKVGEYVEGLLRDIDKNLAEKSWRIMRQMVSDASTVEEVKKLISERRVARIGWCGSTDCAMTLKEAAGGELRGSKFEEAEAPSGGCIVCQRPAVEVVYYARAY